MTRLLLASFVFSLFAGCGDDDGPTPDPDIGLDMAPETAPVIQGLLLSESPASVLAYELVFDTDVPALATVSIAIVGDAPRTLFAETEATMAHAIPVLELRAETAYELSVEVVSPGGTRGTPALENFTTGALPEDFPPVDVEVLDGAAMAPGLTLFGVRRWTPSQDTGWGYLLALDAEGQVVWYVPTNRPPGPVAVRPNGNIVMGYANTSMTELTTLGEELWDRRAADIGTDTFHHENQLLPDGTILALSSELRSISGYPDDQTFDVIGDTVVVVNADATEVMTEYSVFDILDPLRQRPGFNATFWNNVYSEVSESTKDWTHGNAVVVDPTDGNWVLSLRHQDWVAKMDASNGDLIWRFGFEGDFTMSGDGVFPFHTHAPEFDDAGRMLIYDNGNNREGLAEGEDPFTRAVEYELDRETMTATQLWEYRGTAPYYAPFVGDADRLANGNVLITDGGLIVECPGTTIENACTPGNANNQKWARIVEVTREAEPREIFRITLRDDATPTGYTVYRAERLETLYGTP
ncbi:MAG: aryl-sulfate sulfotransferase [Myxococcota bacterium]